MEVIQKKTALIKVYPPRRPPAKLLRDTTSGFAPKNPATTQPVHVELS